MALDSRVLLAIDEAVAEAGEERQLAQTLAALMEGLASGNVSLSERDSAERHIELLFDQVSDQTLTE